MSHQDLGAEHVFITRPGLWVTGIIDFSDAAVADPALDLGLVLREGRDVFNDALAAFGGAGGHMNGVSERAEFYARARAIEDLAFGLERDAAVYTNNALRAMGELFGQG